MKSAKKVMKLAQSIMAENTLSCKWLKENETSSNLNENLLNNEIFSKQYSMA
jgi:hypothetical protein